MSVFALQSRRFWVLLLAASAIASLVAFHLMFNSMPVLKVDITFSRAEALVAAGQLRKKYFPELQTTRNASVFVSNRGLQNYVELEAGGIKAYSAIVGKLDAMTHYWKVRQFSESQEKELASVYSPAGVPLSFWLTLPDQEPGAALEEAAARELAEQGAREFIGERFNAYKPFETVVRRQTSGRADYSFTYEHESFTVGEAKFRIALRVAGDKLVGVDTLSHIPEAFDQRFSAMRAVNNHISQIANYLMMGLFGLGGLVGGGIWLHRRHQLRWKPSLIPAAIVAGGMAMASMANLPMSWMGYNTTVSANNFLLQQFIGAGVVLIRGTLIFATIYSVAEGLSRMAFADHPRLFDFFKKPVAASPEAMGRVLGAYAWAGFFLLYAMLFSLVSRSFGWWSPTNTMTDPNILASWRPALGPIFTALQAGTWEECLYRAVPLALAAIIGKYFGKRTLFVAVALVLQALIFGGGHADYANLPGYSRVVELFIPAMLFGLVYLRFGLVVGMITHFIYDLVLMSLPIFMSNDPSLLIDKALVVLAGATPLLVLLWARYRLGAATPLASEWRNGVPDVIDHGHVTQSEITPAEVPQVKELLSEPTGEKLGGRLPLKFCIPLIVVSLVLVGLSFKKAPEVQWPQFQVNMDQAKAAGEAVLEKHGVKLEGEWHRTSYITNSGSQMMDFVWKETNKTTFQQLVGRYLDTPYWVILWRKFDGPVERRSEQWQAWLYPDGSLHELVHYVPEGDAGAKLTREQAIAKALGWIVEHKWGELNNLEEKSVEEKVQPARSDWVVKYLDRKAFDQKNAKALIQIRISGDEVSGFSRMVDVPDEWARAEASKRSAKMPFQAAFGLTALLLLGLAVSPFFLKHTGRKFNVRLALPWMLLIGLANAIVTLMWMDGDLSGFQTTMGWAPQLWLFFGKAVLQVGVLTLLVFFMVQAIHGENPSAKASVNSDFVFGLTLAAVVAGLFSLLNLTVSSRGVPLAYSADWATYVPLLTVIANGVKAFLPQVFTLIFAIGAVRFIQTRKKAIIFVVLAVIAWALGAFAADEMLLTAISSLIRLLSVALVIWLISRQQLGIALAMLGGTVVFGQLGVSNAIYSGASVHAGVSACCALIVTYGLLRYWHKHRVA